MNAALLGQLALSLVLLLLLAWPLGGYMARVYEGQPCGLDRMFGPLERALYRLTGVRAEEEMGWQDYARALLCFSLLSVLLLYLLQRVQGWLPLNPQGLAGVSPDSACNTTPR